MVDLLNKPLTEKQMAALKRLGELGTNPYGWTAGDVGAAPRTLSALEDRSLIYGGHIYGSRTRSYIIQDRGRLMLTKES